MAPTCHPITMWGQPSEEVEISIDDVNDILIGEESDGGAADTSKRISIVENSIHHVLNLDHERSDCMDDEGRQLKKQSIENGEILGNQSTFPFKNACTILPEHPSRWPQRPLMIRPTPDSSTKVIGIVSNNVFCFATLLAFMPHSYVFHHLAH